VRNTSFFALGIALLVVQSNMYRVVGWLHIAGATPSLLLPLIVFMGVHEYSIARGAALSFLLGYFLDVFASAPVGLFTFITVATFVVARAAGVRLAAQTLVTKVVLALVFGLVEGILVVILTAIFGTEPARPRALAYLVVPHAIATAICAPVIFRLAEHIHAATINMASSGEGASR
jgi:rod shape-determining protein MreD